MSSGIGIDFVIVGAQRGGSTFFADMASQHPQVFIPTLELPVFEQRFYQRWDGEVLDKFLEPGIGKLIGIKRPDSLGAAGVAANIAGRFPKARIVAVLRDPVQRLISAAHWYMYTRLIPVEDFNTVVDRLKEASSSWQDDRNAADPYVQLLRFGAYGWCLQSFHRQFPEESIWVTFNDHLRPPARRDAELARFWDYLGCTEPARPSERQARANRAVYDLRRLQFLSLRPVTFNWEAEDRLRFVRRRHLRHPAKAAVNAGIQIVDRTLLARAFRDGPRVGDDARAWLLDFYRPDIDLLARLTELPPAWRRRYLEQD